MTIWTDSYLKLAANTFSWHSRKIAIEEGMNGKKTGSSRRFFQSQAGQTIYASGKYSSFFTAALWCGKTSAKQTVTSPLLTMQISTAPAKEREGRKLTFSPFSNMP